MASAPNDPLDAALRIAASLEAAGIPYALGGALAYGLWAVPRATVDVDVNVFVADEAIGTVVDALRSLGVQLDPDEARAESARDGMLVGRWGFYRIDVFTPSIAFSWEAERTRILHRVGSREAWFLSAEAIAVFELLFFRTKDLADLERLVALRVELDVAWVRDRIAAMMGEDDERLAWWDQTISAGRS